MHVPLNDLICMVAARKARLVQLMLEGICGLNHLFVHVVSHLIICGNDRMASLVDGLGSYRYKY